MPITADGAAEIARRSRGTPRIANRFLRRVRDFAQVMGDGVVDGAIARKALTALNVDALGLDATDRRMLLTIAKSFGGGPVGLETLAAVIGEESVTLEDVYEPYLLQLGFLNRTPRGRCITPPNGAFKQPGVLQDHAEKAVDVFPRQLRGGDPVDAYIAAVDFKETHQEIYHRGGQKKHRRDRPRAH